LDSTVPKTKINEYTYGDSIKALGGIDILLVGVGNMGHMGFNQPSTSLDAKTRLVDLDKWALISSIPDFSELKFIPKRGLTMGVPNILESKKVLFIATGDHKAEIVMKTVEGSVNNDLIVTYFQNHPFNLKRTLMRQFMWMSGKSVNKNIDSMVCRVCRLDLT
jgi:glucosamine-6-phosphate deaminase